LEGRIDDSLKDAKFFCQLRFEQPFTRPKCAGEDLVQDRAADLLASGEDEYLDLTDKCLCPIKNCLPTMFDIEMILDYHSIRL
jgi:hypothetical protein